MIGPKNIFAINYSATKKALQDKFQELLIHIIFIPNKLDGEATLCCVSLLNGNSQNMSVTNKRLKGHVKFKLKIYCSFACLKKKISHHAIIRPEFELT